MSDTHIISLDPQRGPYVHTSDDELQAAYEQTAINPDSPSAPMILPSCCTAE